MSPLHPCPKALVASCALLLAVSCKPPPQPPTPPPDGPAATGAPSASASTSTATEDAAPAPSAAPARERRWKVYADDMPLLDISDTPGLIVDAHAPPPLPGQVPPKHPFLSASCFGDVMLCSQAGTLLRASKSLDEFLAKLAAEGFRVEEVAAEAP